LSQPERVPLGHTESGGNKRTEKIKREAFKRTPPAGEKGEGGGGVEKGEKGTTEKVKSRFITRRANQPEKGQT